MSKLLVIHEADFELFKAHALAATTIKMEDGETTTRLKLQYNSQLEQAEGRLTELPEGKLFCTVRDCAGDDHLARTVKDSTGVQYLLSTTYLEQVVQEMDDDALDTQIAGYLPITDLLNFTDLQCLEALDLQN